MIDYFHNCLAVRMNNRHGPGAIKYSDTFR